MSPMEKTQKMCENGHVMQPDWDVCPYCPSTRTVNPALARTVRIEDVAAPAPEPAAAPSPRRTEILVTESEPDGVGWLVGWNSPNRGRTHRIDSERASLGAASECDIVLDGEHVSDRHASFRFRDGAFHLTDLDSTNGTFVNGERIQQRTLEDGDRIGFGGSEWVFKCVVFE